MCNGGSGGDEWHVYYNHVGSDRVQEPWQDVRCDDLCTFRAKHWTAEMVMSIDVLTWVCRWGEGSGVFP